jgi:hypothetical protein
MVVRHRKPARWPGRPAISTVQERARTRAATPPRRPGFALAGDLVLALVVLALLLTSSLLHDSVGDAGAALTTDVAQILALVLPGS